MIFAFFLLPEIQGCSEKIDELYKKLGNLLNNNEGYLRFIELNIDKFNISNEDQKERIHTIGGDLPNWIAFFMDLHSINLSAGDILHPEFPIREDIQFWDDDKYIRRAAAEALDDLATSKVNPLSGLLESLLTDKEIFVLTQVLQCK